MVEFWKSVLFEKSFPQGCCKGILMDIQNLKGGEFHEIQKLYFLFVNKHSLKIQVP